jgi:hypothetical protein
VQDTLGLSSCKNLEKPSTYGKDVVATLGLENVPVRFYAAAGFSALGLGSNKRKCDLAGRLALTLSALLVNPDSALVRADEIEDV